jgi:hypothetical protein
VLARRSEHKLSYWLGRGGCYTIRTWMRTHLQHRGRSQIAYMVSHCLIDRDGRIIGCNLPIANGPLLEQAPAMATILRGVGGWCSSG